MLPINYRFIDSRDNSRKKQFWWTHNNQKPGLYRLCFSYLGFQFVSTIVFLVQKHRHDLIILEGYSYRPKAEKYTATCYGPNDIVTTHEYISPRSEKENSIFQTNIAIFIVSVCMPIIPLIGLLLYLLVRIIEDLKK